MTKALRVAPAVIAALIQRNQRIHRQELRTESTGILIAVTHSYKWSPSPTIRMCMMSKYSALLSISAALVLWSMFVVDLGHAVQTENGQDAHNLMLAAMNGSANAPTTQVSNRLNLCSVAGKGRSRARLCGKQSPSGLGTRAAEGSQDTSPIFTMTLTVMLSVLIVLAAWSLALIALAAWSRRTPHPPVEKAHITRSSRGQGQRGSWWARRPSLDNTVSTDWSRRAGLAGFVRSLWFVWFIWSIWLIASV